MDSLQAFIEIPRGARNKYEYDDKLGAIRLDRVLYSSVHYPTDYGFIPETLAEDGDHLDVLVFVEEPTFPGCHVPIRVIGVLNMVDVNGEDQKILAVPVGDPRFDEINDISDISPHWLREIENFFNTYKTLEEVTTVVRGWSPADRALEVIAECRERYVQKEGHTTPGEFSEQRAQAIDLLRKACIVIRPDEAKNMEVTDLGLGDIEHYGLQVVVYVNTDRVCAKELIILPWQICPEHRHPPVEGEPGKEETFRCRYGEVFLYVEGPPTVNPSAKLPPGREEYFNVWHEVILHPGDQYTLPPNTLHWFQAGDAGAVVSEFSSTSRDECDVFTDPGVRRV